MRLVAEWPLDVISAIEQHMDAINAVLEPFEGALAIYASRDYLPSEATVVFESDAVFFTGFNPSSRYLP